MQNQQLLLAATTSTLTLAAISATPPASGPPPAQSPHPGTTNPDPAMHLPIYSKKAVTIAKIYTDDQKYNSISNSFDFKLTIFYNIHRRSGLPPESYMTTFLIILKGLAQVYYYNCSLSTKQFDAAYTYIRNFFEGLEYYRKNLIK
jgi:hypothetical protein